MFQASNVAAHLFQWLKASVRFYLSSDSGQFVAAGARTGWQFHRELRGASASDGLI